MQGYLRGVKSSTRAHNVNRRRPPYRSPWKSRWALAEILVVGLFVTLVAGWAVVRHWTYVMPPLRVPAPLSSAGVDAGEIAAPDLVESDL